MTILSRRATRERQLQIVAAALLNNEALLILAKRLEKEPGEAYALACAYCDEVFGESVGEVAPRMALDRLKLLEVKQAEFKQRRVLREQIKFLRSFDQDLECARHEAHAQGDACDSRIA